MADKMRFEDVLERNGVLVFSSKGTSMRPLIREGRDAVTIRKTDTPPKKLDAVLFRRPGSGAYVLHRILRVNGDGTYWIVGDNCVSGETVAGENILGVLTDVTRKSGRQISTNGFGCRLYARTWCAWYPVRFALIRARNLCAGALGRLRRGRRSEPPDDKEI